MATLVRGVSKKMNRATKVVGLLCQMQTAYISGAKDPSLVVFGKTQTQTIQTQWLRSKVVWQYQNKTTKQLYATQAPCAIRAKMLAHI
jgi:hypothetical protein